MNFRPVGARIRAIAVATAGVILIVGITYASVPDGKGVVHTCYKSSDVAKTGGAVLSVIDPEVGGTCKPGETALPLGQAGPDLYHAFNELSGLSELPLDLVSIALPAGNYLITAKMSAGDYNGPGFTDCYLMLNGTTVLDFNEGVTVQEKMTVSLSFEGVVGSSDPANVTLECTGAGSSPFARFVQMDALKVGTVH